MQSRSRWAVCLAVLVALGGIGARAQASSSLPDAPAPATAAAPATPANTPVPLLPRAPVSEPAPQQAQPSAADANPFPGENTAAPAQPGGDANPFSEAAPPASTSSATATGTASASPESGAATTKNPFPEEEESNAPLAPGSKEDPGSGSHPAPPSLPPLPPGYSSSADSRLKLEDEGSAGAMSPASSGSIAKDLAHDKQVAELYNGQGNWEGAYLRYRNAVKIAPKDADAMFGLADAERRLGRNVSARQHYSAYLDLDPGGHKARAARKAIAELPARDTGSAAEMFAPGPKLP